MTTKFVIMDTTNNQHFEAFVGEDGNITGLRENALIFESEADAQEYLKVNEPNWKIWAAIIEFEL